MAVVAAAFGLVTEAAAQQPASRSLKMQSTWPAGLTLQDNFRFFAERVEKLTGGSLKIEVHAAGQIVPPFEILDATHKKVIDGGHGISYYWVGKSKAATLFSATPAGIAGMDQIDFLGWIYEGGGLELWWELYQKELKLNVIAFPILPSSPQALGWFKEPIKDLASFKGTEVPADRHRRRNLPAHGHADRQPAGRRNRAVGAARRDRLRRMGRRRRGSSPRPAWRLEISLHARHA